MNCQSARKILLHSSDKIQHLQEMSTNTQFDNSGAVSDIETQIQEETECFRVLSIDFCDFLNHTLEQRRA